MRVRLTKADYVWSYIGYFFTLFSNVIILPFVMKKVPSGELGLWYTFISVGQIVNIFDNTFALSVSRNITYAWSGLKTIQAEGFDSNELSKESGANYRLLISIVRTCQAIFLTISLMALVLMLTGGTVFIGYTARALDHKEWCIAWFVYSFGVFLNLFYSYWMTALKGVGAIKQAQISNTIAKITQIVLSLVGLFFNGGIIALSLSFFISGFVMRVLSKKYFMAYEEVRKNYCLYKTQISRMEIKKNFEVIWFNAKKNGLNAVATFCITQTTTLICSAYLGLSETASYGLCLQIITTVSGVAMIYFNTVKPKMTELKIGGEATREGFINSMSLSITIYWILYFLEMVVILTLGLPAIKLLKADTEIPFFMVFFMGLYLFLENNHSIFCGILEMSNKVPYVRAGVISSSCIAIGELITAHFLRANIYGLMFVQFAIQLTYNNWHWPMVVMKEYHLNPLKILVTGCKEGVTVAKNYLRKDIG